jgi:large subunit ribosomal protein L21
MAVSLGGWMYAIIETGGKQYKVAKDDVIDVELLDENSQVFSFNSVLFLHDGKQSIVGSPHVEKALVEAEIIGQVRGPKVIAYKYKRRKRFKKKIGHRQNYSRVKIKNIAMK